MADNIDVTPGTGKTIAADDITGVLHQRVKISQGADGSATDVSATDPLNVTLANTGVNSTALKVDGSGATQPVSGTVTANAGTGSFTVTQGTASNLKVDLSGTAANATALKVDGSAATQPVSGTFWQAIQPVSGTVTANAGTNLNTSALALDATLTGGTQQTKLTDGTNVANTLKSDGTAAGQNSQLVAGTYLSVPFTTTTVQAVGTTDAGNYNSVTVYVSSQGTSSTVTFQASSDNTNWVSLLLVNTNTGLTGSSTQNTVHIWQGNLSYRYFRLSVTGISAGTTAGTIVFKTNGISGTQMVTSTSATGSAIPASAFMVGGSDGTNLIATRIATPADANGNIAALVTSSRGSLYNGATWDMQRGNATDGTQVYVKGTTTDNGLVASKVVCAATTNATSVKASAGKIYRIDAFNSDTVGYWVKFYNKASAPTVGTDVPVATKFVPAGGGFVIESTLGIPYTTGIALAATLNATDADTVAVTTANKLVINLRYV